MAATFGGWGGRRKNKTGRGEEALPSNPSPLTASLGFRVAARAVLVCLLFFCVVCFLPSAVTATGSTITSTATATTITSAATSTAEATDAGADASTTITSTATVTTITSAGTATAEATDAGSDASTTTTNTATATAAATTATATTTTATTTATVVKPEPYSESAVKENGKRSSAYHHHHPRPSHADPHLRRVLAPPKPSFPPDNKAGDDGSKCWLFTHMPKSGGSTIRDLLKDKWGRDKFIKYGNPEWKYGEKHARKMLSGKYRIFAGSHAEALRRYGGERCQGFTMFRHPISRVVSAYFYCKKAPEDPLCATSVMKAKSVDLLTFVQHWGNFGLRLFSLSMGDADANDIMKWAKSARQPIGASGWYLQRKYMEAHSERHDAPDSALYSMLAPAKEHLNTSFAAVGILENFDTSLSLYDSALQMPGEGWHQWYAKIGPRNVDVLHKQEEEEALKSAWTDPRFKHFLMLDLELYDFAVRVHNEQLERYGLPVYKGTATETTSASRGRTP